MSGNLAIGQLNKSGKSTLTSWQSSFVSTSQVIKWSESPVQYASTTKTVFMLYTFFKFLFLFVQRCNEEEINKEGQRSKEVVISGIANQIQKIAISLCKKEKCILTIPDNVYMCSFCMALF